MIMLFCFQSKPEQRSLAVRQEEGWANSQWIHEGLHLLHDKFHSLPGTGRCRFPGGNHTRRSLWCQSASSPAATPLHESTSHSPWWPEYGQRTQHNNQHLCSACHATLSEHLCTLSFQDQMVLQTPSSFSILLVARSLLLLMSVSSAHVGAGHEQILHSCKADSHLSLSTASFPVSTGLRKIRLEVCYF